MKKPRIIFEGKIGGDPNNPWPILASWRFRQEIEKMKEEEIPVEYWNDGKN